MCMQYLYYCSHIHTQDQWPSSALNMATSVLEAVQSFKNLAAKMAIQAPVTTTVDPTVSGFSNTACGSLWWGPNVGNDDLIPILCCALATVGLVHFLTCARYRVKGRNFVWVRTVVVFRQ